MTYAIAKIVYGIDLTHHYGETPAWMLHLSEDLRKDIEDGDPQDYGLGCGYSGSGEPPTWLGPSIGKFDECRNFPLATLKRYMEVNADMIDKWNACLAEVHPEVLKAIIETYGVRGSLEPRVMVIWCSS